MNWKHWSWLSWLGGVLLVGCGGSSSRESGDEGVPSYFDSGTPVYNSAGDDQSEDESADAGTGTCLTVACDPRLATDSGCAETQKCSLVSTIATCVTEADGGTDVAQGQPCTDSTECAAGLACFDRGDYGTCEEICCGSESSCGAGTECVNAALFDDVSSTWGYCSEPSACDITEPIESCSVELGTACYVVSQDGLVACQSAGVLETGFPCTQSNECAPGLICVGLETSTCRRVCTLNTTALLCPPEEGLCEAQAYSPPGSGICTDSGL